MTKEESLSLEEPVKQALEKGSSKEEVIRTFGISEYYVKKWSRQVYKDMDIDMFVRRRYSNIVCETRYKVEAKIGDLLSGISEENWEQLDTILKNCFYDFAKDIIKKN